MFRVADRRHDGARIAGRAQRETIRCSSCDALLFKAEPAAIAGIIEIKCRRCSALNCLRPQSP